MSEAKLPSFRYLKRAAPCAALLCFVWISTRCPRRPSWWRVCRHDRADIAQMFLLEGHAAAGEAGLFLHGFLAGQIAAPHGLDETGGPWKPFSLISSMVVALMVRASRFFSARSYRSLRQGVQRGVGMAVGRSSKLDELLLAVCRDAPARTDPARCPGGQPPGAGAHPFISHWANFQPGCLSLSSSFTRAYWPMAAASSRLFSSTPGLWAATGTMTTCTGAMAGGRIRPSSSPWVMMMAPIRRLEAPQLVWKGYCSVLSRPVKVTS